jgi:hypothetical protein
MIDNWSANTFNEYRTLMTQDPKKKHTTFDERQREVESDRNKYMDEKRYWKKRKWKLDKTDLIWDNPNTNPRRKVLGR